jgi:hypothetical protein
MQVKTKYKIRMASLQLYEILVYKIYPTYAKASSVATIISIITKKL